MLPATAWIATAQVDAVIVVKSAAEEEAAAVVAAVEIVNSTAQIEAQWDRATATQTAPAPHTTTLDVKSEGEARKARGEIGSKVI